ncbi:ATP-dependent DNA helicase DDX11-like isoform X2 [Oculina patagonica]
MENLPKDELSTRKRPLNCDFKQAASNQPFEGESMAKDKPIFFPFPFPPYDIQEDFMTTLYHVLENGGVGIFESPTGTGKSLSLICGALTWLKDYEEKRQVELEKALACAKQVGNQRESVTLEDKGKTIDSKDTSSTPDWVTEFAEKQAKQEAEDRIKEERERLEKQKAQLQKLKSEIKPAFTVKYGKRKHSDESSSNSHNDEEIEHKIANEIDEVLGKTSPDDPDADIVLTEYLSDREDAVSDQEEEEKEEEPHCLKLFYCSRTHSQLAQFVREVQKSPFNDSTRVVSLGSRQNLCINEEVKSLKNINKINDRCLELQKKDKDKKKSSGENAPKKKKLAKGCPFYAYQQLQKFRDHVLVDIKDIEQLVSVGEELHACPYYGTRLAIPPAQLVVLPYNILLHKSTREACGIKLDGNVVIIDEAHNLIDTISSVYSVEITGSQILCAHSQLTQYQDRYRTRLKAKNLLYIQQLLYVLTCFLNCLGGKDQILSKMISTTTADEGGPKEAKMQDVKLKTINDFLFSAQMDNVNLFKIKKYCEKSIISKKLNGFIDRYQSVQVGTATEEDTLYQSSSSPLQIIESFLEALTNADKDGRVVVNKQDRLSSSSLKFLLLNPAVHFTNIVREARAVIVAGGTMQPMSDFKDQLFTCAGLPSANIVEFSCGHVIPAEHLLAVALDRGPSGRELDFTYQSRDSAQLKEELGRLLINIFAVVPGGVVCFFSSYDYEQQVYKHWQTTGILDKMNARKKVFREPRKANQLDQVLSSYASCIKPAVTANTTSPNGAVLFCVVGGKMSEGINFSDDLGRCVVMVGLPYPNIYSPELKEKMAYLDATLGPKAGQTHYENLCMKAVNQSIGRAIRHRGDYATILLLDQRYGSARIQKSLPGWISNRLQHQARFGSAFAAIRKFFVDKRLTGGVTE